MMPEPTMFPIVLPSETRSREFDAKLLLAGLLADLGHPVFVGCRVDIHNRIHRLPRGLYLAKDIRSSSRRMFRILAQLGFAIAAWDEESLVFTDEKTYHRRRVDRENLNRIKAFFAWGARDHALIESAPGYDGTPIFETGNPRIDLLMPRCREFFASDVAALRARFGEFILINSNFGQVNHFLPGLGVTRRPDGSLTNLGAATAEWWEYRLKLFEAFKVMLPALARTFPDRHFVLRPHPAESREAWCDATQGLPNVTVIHEGPVHPWLMASAVAIHNGCTTGLESYLLDHPVISYRPVVSQGFDDQLPDQVSTQIFHLDELIAMLNKHFDGEPLPRPDAHVRALVERRVGTLDGGLASERIAAIIAAQGATWLEPQPPLLKRVAGRVISVGRGVSKMVNAYRSGHKNSRYYSDHRFPPLAITEVQERLARLSQVTGRMTDVTVHQIHRNIFRLSRG